MNAERIEILRRIAERGKARAEDLRDDYYLSPVSAEFTDLFVHLLDELKRVEVTE